MFQLKIYDDERRKLLSSATPMSANQVTLQAAACTVTYTAIAFVVRFLTKRFICEYMKNEDLRYEHATRFSDGNWHRFEILDISNLRRDCKEEQRFDDSIKWGDVFFILFSVTGEYYCILTVLKMV